MIYGLLKKDNNLKPILQYVKIPKDKVNNNSFNIKDGTVVISRIGTLNYMAGNVQTYIENYRVLKTNLKGECIALNDVFTDININEMSSNVKYKEFVLHELLSESNINRLNSMGYVGEIYLDNSKDSDREYKIEYLPEEYTAVTLLRERLRNNNKSKEER